VTPTVTILRAGLRLPATGIVLTAREGLKQTPAPCAGPGSASCLTGPAARARRWTGGCFPARCRASVPWARHPTCAGRVFKARAAQ
jgi:hypothetical protein